MAGGGKETPRQKMIGMMYLFLTAMLAINVSDSLLHRFLFINDTLEDAAELTHEKNEQFLRGIEKQVQERKNQAEDLKVLEDAKRVRNLAEQMRENIEEIKGIWIEETGGYQEDSAELIGFKETEFIANYMITQGKGEQFKDSLNAYARLVAEIIGEQPEKIAMDGEEHPSFQNDPNQAKKDFSELFFEGTPLAAGLATMTQFENEVLRIENDALENLADRVGANAIDFDVIKAMVRPESQRVAAGTEYRADLFIAASSSAFKPVMFFNGSSIPVDTSGVGTISFVAQPGDYDASGLAQKSYEAVIKLDLPGGKDTTFTETIDYFVIKPTIQIQSASVNALYFKCGNELSVAVPALGSSYNPTFKATGAEVVSGTGGNVTLVPNGREVVLSVYNDGNLIGTQDFGVRAVPRPEVQIQLGGRPLDAQRGLRTTDLRAMEAKVIPDADFARLLPNDARYRVSEWKVTLASGPRPKGEPKVFRNGDGDLSSFRSAARPGDRLVIEVLKVERLNFQGRREEVPVGFQPMSIPIN